MFKLPFQNRRWLALEWDAREARIVVAHRLPTLEMEIEHAFVVDLRPRDAAPIADPESIGHQIAAAFSARGIDRCEMLVAVGRTSIELRRLTVPPVPADELPDLVRFQAQRQFAALGDDWLLDFVPLHTSGATDGVLAAAIAPDLVRQVQAVCQAARQPPRRMVLRPFAAASLWTQNSDHVDWGGVLIVDLLAEEADLTVLVEGEVVFLRTIRLDQHSHEASDPTLVSEIRRTIGAAQNQLGGGKIGHIVIFGDRPHHAALKTDVENALALPVSLFDPFAGLLLSHEVQTHRPEHPARFAPLLGMVLDASFAQRPAIDFLNPRRRPVPPNPKRLVALVAAVAALVLLAIAIFVRSSLVALDHQIDQLQSEIARYDELLKRADAKVKEAKELDSWSQGDIVWLDELRDLAARYPPSSDLVITQLSLASQAGREGQVAIEGRARQASVFPSMVTPLSDARHKVEFPAGSEDPSENPAYPWRFKQSLTISAAEPLPLPTPEKPTRSSRENSEARP